MGLADEFMKGWREYRNAAPAGARAPRGAVVLDRGSVICTKEQRRRKTRTAVLVAVLALVSGFGAGEQWGLARGREERREATRILREKVAAQLAACDSIRQIAQAMETTTWKKDPTVRALNTKMDEEP